MRFRDDKGRALLLRIALLVIAVSVLGAARPPARWVHHHRVIPMCLPGQRQNHKKKRQRCIPQPKIGIVINGEVLPLEPRPLLLNGHLLVPVQRTVHALGLDFERHGSRMITHVGAQTIVLRDGSRFALVDEQRIVLDVPVTLLNDVFYAPLRFFTKVLGASATYQRGVVTIVAQLVGFAGEGLIPEGNRTLHVGTVTAVDLNGYPPTITLAFNGQVRTIGISRNALITLRDVAVDVDTPGELSDVHPGDYAEITTLNKSGKVLSVVDAYGSRYGEIAAINGSEFVLQDGHVIEPDRDTTISLDAQPATLDDLRIGDRVAVRYNVETGEVREVAAERAQAPLSAQSGSARIDSVTTDAARPLRAGRVLRVTMRGSRGGAATFDVGSYLQNMAMAEGPPGVYVGTYRIPQSATFAGVPLLVQLAMPDGSRVQAEAAQTLSVAGMPPGISSIGPSDGDTVDGDKPAIYATFTAQAVPIDPSSIHVEVNGMDVTDDCLRTPTFVQYLPGREYHGVVRVTVRVADEAGNTTTKSWSFVVKI
jgi:hypothetical protein